MWMFVEMMGIIGPMFIRIYNGRLAIYNEGQHSLPPSRIDIIIKKLPPTQPVS